MNRQQSNSQISENTFSPVWLLWFLLPGFLSLSFASVKVVATVFLGLLIFSLPGFYLARLLLKNPTDGKQLSLVALPLGYLLSTALTVIITAISGLNPWVSLAAVLLVGIPLFKSFEWKKIPGCPVTILLVCAILILLIIPYNHVGIECDDGFAYRAYYSGDYLKHVAVTAELTRGVIPPDNPYYAGEKLHYYWMFYLFPALVSKITGPDTIEPVLKTVNIFIAGLFIWVWIMAVWHFIRKTWCRIIILISPILLGSYEGIAVLLNAHSKGWPLDGFRAYNVDGYSRWIMGHPEIDTVFRLIQYNMQHIIPAMLFLIFLQVFKSRQHITRSQAAIIGIVCALTIGHSGFLGSFLTLWTGICLIATGPFNLKGFRERIILGSLMSIFPVLGLFIYKTGFQMLGSGGNPLALTVVDPILKQPILFFVLNFGPLAVGIAGLLFVKKIHRPTMILAVLALFWICFVIVPDWPSDVGVKVGYTLALALALMLGQLIDTILPEKKSVQITAAIILVISGIFALPSIFCEIFNSQDLLNKRYVSFINPVDMEAFQFMRDTLPLSSRIQTGPGTELNAPFSPVPTFAHHHTYCGDWMHAHIFLIPESLYKIRLEQITRMFSDKNVPLVYKLCHDAGITHLYWGVNEFHSYGSADHLVQNELFKPVWRYISGDYQCFLLEIQ